MNKPSVSFMKKETYSVYREPHRYSNKLWNFQTINEASNDYHLKFTLKLSRIAVAFVG